MINKLTKIIASPKRDCIYDILQHMDLGLCVDIGAAAGSATRRICLAGCEKTKLIAFEPFPGNHQYFYRTVENLNNAISLVEKAVSDNVGVSKFIVRTVVQGTEPGWHDYVGYSSIGFLSSVRETNFLQVIKLGIQNTVRGLTGRQIPRVNTTTIDHEFPNEEIHFMKIDFQGAEGKVLYGANEALKANRILSLYIEWSGEPEVVEILSNYGYLLYDSTYIIIPNTPSIEPFERIGFRFTKEVNLSSGKVAYDMVLEDDNVSPVQAVNEVKNCKIGSIQTDLIAVAPKVKKSFLMAVEKYATEQASNAIVTT